MRVHRSQLSSDKTATNEYGAIFRAGGDEVVGIIRIGDQQIGAGAGPDSPVIAKADDGGRRGRHHVEGGAEIGKP
jgi:hypothetical protein